MPMVEEPPIEPLARRSQAPLETDDETHAEELNPDRPSDWGSLLADLSRGSGEPAINLHDRTHVELAVDYRMRPGRATETFQWEAYFFAPESLRLDSRTYSKEDLYEDLQSYVRFAVPEHPYSSLIEAPLTRVRTAVATGSDDEAMREMRLFSCMVRAAGV